MIELADVIHQLRAELQRALSGSPYGYEQIQLELGPIEFEVMLALQSDRGGAAGIRFWVLDLDGKDIPSGAATQRLKLTLQPKVSSMKGRVSDVLIRDESAP